MKILEEVPELLNQHAKPNNTNAYPNWAAFLKAFLARGIYNIDTHIQLSRTLFFSISTK